MGVLREAAKQAALLWLMYGAANAWFEAYAPALGDAALARGDALALARRAADPLFLGATGAALAAVSALYTQLPVKIIPRALPLVGKLDTMLASGVLAFGLALMWLAWWTGSASVREALRPYLGDLVDPGVLEGYAAVVLRQVDELYSACVTATLPAARAAGDALERACPYLAHVEPHLMPIFEAVTRGAGRIAEEVVGALGLS